MGCAASAAAVAPPPTPPRTSRGATYLTIETEGVLLFKHATRGAPLQPAPAAVVAGYGVYLRPGAVALLQWATHAFDGVALWTHASTTAFWDALPQVPRLPMFTAAHCRFDMTVNAYVKCLATLRARLPSDHALQHARVLHVDTRRDAVDRDLAAHFVLAPLYHPPIRSGGAPDTDATAMQELQTLLASRLAAPMPLVRPVAVRPATCTDHGQHSDGSGGVRDAALSASRTKFPAGAFAHHV